MIYKELNAAGTFTLKTGAGFLNSVVVNSLGTSGTLQIFDNISATAPAIAGATAFALVAGSSLNYQAHFNTGLTIVVGGTSPSVTISYT